MPLPAGITLIDLRPPEVRQADPLDALVATPVRGVTLAEIEDGGHGLTPADGPLVVICERGVRSGLAARFLRADGLDASAYEGGVPALKRGLGAAGG